MYKEYHHKATCKVCGTVFEYDSGNRETAREYCDKHQPAANRQVGVHDVIELECAICGRRFEHLKTHRSGYTRRYCDECRKELQRQRSYELRVRHGYIKKPGVGSGNNQGYGEVNHSYTTGSGSYRKMALAIIPPEQWKCYYCGAASSKSRIDPTKELPLLVHHIDGNRNNNVPSNWRIVCKRCHQVIEHNCEGHLPQNKYAVDDKSRN